MKRFSSTLGAILICAISFASVSQKQFVVFFQTDSFSLDAAATAQLDTVIAHIQGKYYEMLLDAHTDAIGTSNYNVELSKKRALGVQQYLAAKGVDEKRLQFNWFGENKPVQSNATDIGKQANRRVNVHVTVYDWRSVEEMMRDVSESRQQFQINARENATIETSGGIKIEIPGNAFITKNGTPITGQDVTVVLTEALSRESWLTEGLSTISPDGILESAGMFKIEALQNGEQLMLKEGNQVNVQVPFESRADGMALFYASTDAVKNTVWQQSNEPVRAQLAVELPVLNVDSKKLDELISKYAGMRAAYIGVDSAFLQLPVQPQMQLSPPRKPKMPVKEEIRVHSSGMKSWFVTKKQKDKQIEMAYEKRMKVYEKNLAYYNKRLQKYNVAKENFEKALEVFNASQPEYQKLIASAIATFDTLKALYERNIAYDRIYSCLSALKYKLSTKQVTDPNYVSDLINFYSYKMYSHNVEFPKEMLAIKEKLAELGYSSPNEVRGEVWSSDYTFSRIWSGDQDLMSLLNDASKKLIADRLAKGVSSNRELSGYYLTSLSNLGWINIDKFSKMNQSLSASLSIDHDPSGRVFVIFDDINSVLEYKGSALSVPQNTAMTVFSITLINNQPHYAVAKISPNPKKTNIVALKYREGLLKDIKSAIKEAV